MIIGHKHKYVYLATPKTATRSMAGWLISRFGGVVHNSDHYQYVPPGCKDYYLFTTVRNPYSRAVSFWWWACHVWKKKWLRARVQGDFGNMRIDSFFKFVLANPRRIIDQKAFMSQCAFLTEYYPDALKMEELPFCLERLPFAHAAAIRQFPFDNKTSHDSWWKYMHPDVLDLVEKWAEGDFKRFGYDHIART